MWKIVETDNYGRDCPMESFLVQFPFQDKLDAQTVAELINDAAGPNAQRYWKVVSSDYILDISTPA